MLKEKIHVFFLGLMLGVLISGGFFILKLDDYFKELKVYKSLTHKLKAEKNSEDQEIKKNDKGKNETKSKKNDAPVVNKIDKDFMQDPPDTGSVKILSEVDSVNISTDSLVSKPIETIESEEIIVRKDEMLSTKMLEVIMMDDKKPKSDSLVEEISGIKEEIPTSSYKVEYWKSPLNYKGYKLTKNRIVLYGISPMDGIKLYKFENTLYLKHLSSLYKIEYSIEFRPLEKVSNENLLARLK